jgi:type IV secretory pathway VirB10-like protein
MFSKPLAFVLLGLGCITAAAGGAYVATRHNLSDAATVATHAAAPATPAAAPSQPVAETEAAVTAPRTAEATPAEPVKAEAPDAAPKRVDPPAAHKATDAPKRKPEPAVTARASEPPAVPRPVQRTVPLNGAGAAPVQSDPAAVAPASTVTPPPPAAHAIEASKPIDPPQPEPARAPQFDELILPASSVIGLQIETSTSTERARVEDRVDARVSRDVMAGGRVAIPAGSRVIGSVTTVERGGKMKEQARLGIRFHTLVLADGSEIALHTDPVFRNGESPAASSSKKIGGAAIGGAILGAILGGSKGAAIGGATGAAGGTAAVMAGDRSVAALRQGEYLNVKLASPATITVERNDQ